MKKTLKQTLRDLGVTQRELGQQMDLDVSQVCNLLSDRVVPTFMKPMKANPAGG